MIRQLLITSDPIDQPALLRDRAVKPEFGAVVEFLGYVRASEGDTRITGIEYEAFVHMVEHQFGLIFDAIKQRWPIASVRLVHRVGFVAVGEPSLWVEVVAPHRAEAFAACQHIIDEMKRVVPIWKRPVAAREGNASEQPRPVQVPPPDVSP